MTALASAMMEGEEFWTNVATALANDGMKTGAARASGAKGRLSLLAATLVVSSIKDQLYFSQYDLRTELRVSPSAWNHVRLLAAATSTETFSHLTPTLWRTPLARSMTPVMASTVPRPCLVRARARAGASLASTRSVGKSFSRSTRYVCVRFCCLSVEASEESHGLTTKATPRVPAVAMTTPVLRCDASLVCGLAADAAQG